MSDESEEPNRKRKPRSPYAADGQTFAERRRAYVRMLDNPYANLGVDDQGLSVAAASNIARAAAPARTCSKAEFNVGCRAVFRHYMPALERGKLRDHYREFISRNESRSPEMRFRVLHQLKRYDLSLHVGLTGQFNRERDVFTEEKLRAIERDAGVVD